jgi:hypothetical protein
MEEHSREYPMRTLQNIQSQKTGRDWEPVTVPRRIRRQEDQTKAMLPPWLDLGIEKDASGKTVEI